MTARFSLEQLLSLDHLLASIARPQSPRHGADGPTGHASPELELPAGLALPRVGHEASSTPSADTPPADSEVDEALFLPEGYEPKYAYPLLVWLQPAGEGVPHLEAVMPQISLRNYLGVSVTVPAACAAGHSADAFDELDALAEIEQRLFATVSQVRRRYHVHTERVFLVGFDRTATLALRLGLHRPEWFAGVAAFAAQFPAARHPLNRFRDLRGKRVLLGLGRRDTTEAQAEVQQTARLLHNAGLRVCLRGYDAGRELSADMLSDIDRWVMREIYQPKSPPVKTRAE